MRTDFPRSAPNYTDACMVMLAVNLIWFFVVIWAVWGPIVAGLIAICLNHLINRLRERKLARMGARPRR